MRKNRFGRVLALLGIALIGGPMTGIASGDSPPKSKPLTPEQQQQVLEELKDLRDRVQVLEKEKAENAAPKESNLQLQDKVQNLQQDVLVLKRQDEIDKADAAEKAKTNPIVSVLSNTGEFAITSPDKAFQLKILGWISYDIAWFKQHDGLEQAIGDEQDGTGFSALRLRFTGTLYQNTDYQLELEFSGQNGTDTPSLRDTYVRFRDIPYFAGLKGDLTMGHFREPLGLEDLTNDPARMFQEESLNSTFYPSRNPGVQWSDALLGDPGHERLYYAVGIFKDSDLWPSSNDSDEDQGWAITARVTGLPYYAYNGERLLHLGVSYSHRNPDGAVLGWAGKTESKLVLFKYSDTEKFTNYKLSNARADNVDLLNFELASVWGPLTLQGEYTVADVKTTFDGNDTFRGFYAQASYTLTGESRPYRNDNATFDRLTPKNNFAWGKGGGWGAWEVAARYSEVDLSNGGVRGGEQSEFSAQLRWYLNRSANLSLDYIRNHAENGLLYDGDFDSLQLRATIYF